MAQTLDEDPQRFLLLDNGAEERRLIIFASQVCLRYLATSASWYVDGNFSMSPCNLQFQQLYVIRCDIGRSAVTTAYALMQRRDDASYREMFTTIINACPVRPNPNRIHFDFESAVINVARDLFPNSTITGCFYHLCQVSVLF